jgi:phosphoglycerate dehydrogenase-like enzyme
MTVLLIDRAMYEAYSEEIARIESVTGGSIEPLFIPPPGERLTSEDLERIEIGTPPNGDYEPEGARRFYGGATRAPNLRWVHLPHAGVDDPVFGRLLDAGVRLTNASGAMAEPIASSAIGGLLQLARGFPRWAAAQERHEWDPHPQAEFPRDLREQTIVVFGLGAIGIEIARLARALHLHVIGVRRSAARDGDPVDELVTPAQLAEVLPRADWLAIASPLTDQTSGLFDEKLLALLPAGARIVNIARGEIIDEAAMTARLADGRLGGAYLDVFEEEPLPAESPLWDLPRVILSPHDSSTTTAVDKRLSGYFLRNLEHWLRREALETEVLER